MKTHWIKHFGYKTHWMKTHWMQNTLDEKRIGKKNHIG